MVPNDELVIISDLRRAKKTKADNVRFHLRRKKLTRLPSKISEIKHIKRVEIDLSYNRDLIHEDTFHKLAELGNVYGLGLIKHEKGKLDDSIGLLDKLEVLDLWTNGLTELPASFANLKNLKVLNLRNNHLKEIPSYFKEFKKLQNLNLQFNKIKKVPDFIYTLSELEELNLSTCGLTELSPKLGQLKKLKKLNIAKNSITTLPDCFDNIPLEEITFLPGKKIDLDQYFKVLSKAKTLKKLDLSNLKLKNLPESIGLMSQLEELNISQNDIKELPEAFGNLNLKVLHLNSNPLNLKQTLPILGQLKCFTRLNSRDFGDFRTQSSAEIPASIVDCPYITEMHLTDNTDITFPNEMANCQSLESISIYSSLIKEVPLVIQKMKNLKSLTLHSNIQLTKVEDWVYELDFLDNFSFSNNGVELDQDKAAKLRGISVWHLKDLSDSSFEKVANMPNIKQLHFPKYDEPFVLPDVFYTMTQLEVIMLARFKKIDMEDFINRVDQFINLKELWFSYNQTVDINAIAEKVPHLPQLEKLMASSHTKLTEAALLKFKSLKEFTLRTCLLYTSPSPRDGLLSRMPSSA